MNITEDIKYIGVNDTRDRLFEGQFTVPLGIAYNSYLIADEKVAVMDSVDKDFSEEWLSNIEKALGGRAPDYLVVQHMEPDHSGSIIAFMNRFKNACLVSSAKAFTMMKNFFNDEFAQRRVVVANSDKLSLGKHTLSFIFAPMVHWPEVMVSYDEYDKVLFSADGFGKFGALGIDDDDWACEARRYYFGIVGKYGAQVQALLKKAAALDIEIICPLHGPVLKENLSYYIGLYDTWSSYKPEEEGIAVVYTSVYGNTEHAVNMLEKELRANGYANIHISKLGECDMAEAVEDAFRYDKLVLATTTYNAHIFPYMSHFISALVERGYQNRKIAFIENGSWAPMAAKVMRQSFENSKNITYLENTVKINSALDERSTEELKALAKELCEA